MNTPRKIEVIAQPGSSPEAVLDTNHPFTVPSKSVGCRIIPRGKWDLELCERWGCLVTCTPEFSAWWKARGGRPHGFFLEVLA